MAITLNSMSYNAVGNRQQIIASIAMDSSYSFGGESLGIKTLLGIQSSEIDLVLIENPEGYSLKYDYDNDKIKVFAPAPPIIYEEYHELDDDYQFTLNYPPAFILNVAQPGQNIKLRSPAIAYASLSEGDTSATEQFEEGTRSTFTLHPIDGLAGDGAFTGAATNWTLAAGWAYPGDTENNIGHTGNGVGTAAHDNFAAVVGKKYRVTFTISKITGVALTGTVTPTLGGVAGTAVDVTTAEDTGTEFTQDFTATTTDGLLFTPSNTSRFVIDSITVMPIDVYASYVTQAWKDVWDNLVQDEEVTLSSGGTVNMDNTILAVMYADRTSATAKALTLIDEDDAAASGEVAFYFGVSTAQIKACHADENSKVAKVTYVKKPSSGFLYDRAFYNETATAAGDDPYTHTFDYPILLWGYAGQVPFNTGVTQRFIEYMGTPAAGEAVIDWYTPGARGAGAPATGTVVGVKSNLGAGVTGAGVWGTMSEVRTQLLEVPDGTDLSALNNIKILVICK